MGTASWLQGIAALGFVLGLMALAAWSIRRLGLARPAAAAPIRTVATIAVGARERVVIVETGELWLVLGVAAGRVSPLHVMPRGEMPAAAEAPDFRTLLGRLRG